MPEVDVSQVGQLPAPEAPKPLPAPPLNNDSEGVSPTGAPVIPPKAVPYVVGVVATAGVLHEMVSNPTVQLVTAIVLAVGVALGVASPGLRRK